MGLKRTIVCLLILLCMLPVSGIAEEAERQVSGDYVYTVLKDGSAEIVKYIGTLPSVQIPDALDGHPTVSIAADAFEDAESMTAVSIPDSVETIAGNPFRHCAELVRISVSRSHPTLETVNGVLAEKNKRELICYPQGFQAESYAIPDSILSIGAFAFYNASNLLAIAIPASVMHIGDSAFSECYNLKSIVIPNSVVSIGDFAFGECSLMTTVVLSDSVQEMGANPFMGCNYLDNVHIPASQPNFALIDDALVDKRTMRLISYFTSLSGQKNYRVADGIQAIGAYAFYCAYHLESIELPDSVTSIGDFAFMQSIELASISIPDSTTDIGANPFADCEDLRSIWISPDHPTLASINGVLFNKTRKELVWYPYDNLESEYEVPNGILAIDGFAFYHCSLSSVILPETLISIGNNAFRLSECLESIELPENLAVIGDEAFSFCFSLEAITIPASVTSIGKDVFNGSGVFLATVEQGSYADQYVHENNIRFNYTNANDWLLS